MAAEIDALSAHVRRTRLLSQLDQVGDRALELRREHVVCVITKALVAERNVWRIFERFLPPATQVLPPHVFDSRAGQGFLQRFAIEMRQAARHREGADVH